MYVTWISSLNIGDKVIEYHKSSGYKLISTVVSITPTKIGVKRINNSVVYYDPNSCMIIYEYGTIIPNFYLMQYEYPTEGTPQHPTPLEYMEEVSSINYQGNLNDTYVNLTLDEGSNAINPTVSLVDPYIALSIVGSDAAYNQSNVKLYRSGDTITIIGKLNDIKSYSSNLISSGAHKWVGIDINTNEPTIIGISINNTALTNTDVSNANALELPAGHYLYWAQLDSIDTSPAAFVFTSDGKVSNKLYFRFEEVS